MKKIEFYQIVVNILSTFFQILSMNVIKYFGLVVCLEKIINF